MRDSTNPMTMLLVEDNRAHAQLIIRHFQNHRIPNRIIHLLHGEEALHYLFRQGSYADPEKSPRPHMILLDLRLPRIDGLDVLREVKTTEELAKIPVVIWSTSDAEQDISRAYTLHANSYIVKPLDFTRFSTMIEDLGVYWLSCNYYPWS